MFKFSINNIYFASFFVALDAVPSCVSVFIAASGLMQDFKTISEM